MKKIIKVEKSKKKLFDYWYQQSAIILWLKMLCPLDSIDSSYLQPRNYVHEFNKNNWFGMEE